MAKKYYFFTEYECSPAHLREIWGVCLHLSTMTDNVICNLQQLSFSNNCKYKYLYVFLQLKSSSS